MAVDFDFAVDSAAVERRMLEVARRYPEAGATAVYQEALALLAESKQEVPVQYGTLRRSGYADAPSGVDDPHCVVGYGTNYALPVHERIEVFHPVGKSKFLIDPMLRRAAGYKERMTKRIAQNVRDGVTLGDVSGGGGSSE